MISYNMSFQFNNIRRIYISEFQIVDKFDLRPSFLVQTYLIAWVCTCLLASPCTFIFALYFLEYAGGLPIIVLGKCICIFVFPMRKPHVLQVLYDMHNLKTWAIYLVSEGNYEI